MSKNTSILIHYTHKETLGHTTRILSICHELAKNCPQRKIYVLQGGIPQPFVRFPSSIHVLNVPAPFDSRSSFQGIHAQKNLAQRSQFILEAAKRIQPGIFVTEFFPLGRMEYLPELLPALRYLRRLKTRIYASVGYPYLTSLPDLKNKKFSDIFYSIVGLYDKILIHTPKNLENPYLRASLDSKELQKHYDQFFHTMARKIIYTGYIPPVAQSPEPRIHALLKKKPGMLTVVVSRGGGAVYPKIIVNAIRAQSLLGERYRFIIASGPSTSHEERSLFKAFLEKSRSKNISFFEHIPALSYFLENCDASVSMCGYNTSVQLLSFNTQSIIIPYMNERSKGPANDQIARAGLLKDYLKSTVLPYHTMTPAMLAKAIHQKCETPQKKKRVPPSWLHGSAATAKLLTQENGN
ncbi:MAG: hypothetical protein HQL16_03860 [Candidatus Omnitrophica bacterium]|nr:hypothetical protein [Candidatus Omnitrophota bacterium]